MALPTADEVTNMYLYGHTSDPTNKIDDTYIRASNVTTNINVPVSEYMASIGRFALGSQFELVEQFFANGATTLAPNDISKPYYTKEEVRIALGLGNVFIEVDQKHVADGTDDYATRVYIWNSTQFKIADNAKFIVESNGDVRIEDYAVEPYLGLSNIKENFDFVGGGELTQFANGELIDVVDPSRIGRKVEFTFTGSVTTSTYDLSDFMADQSTASGWTNPILGIDGEVADLALDLWLGGSTNFIHGLRPIIYGTAGADDLSIADLNSGSTWADVNGVPTVADSAYANQGVALLGGAGNDTLSGTWTYGDILRGGLDADVIYGDSQNDTLEGSPLPGGNDSLYGGDGNDTIWGGAGNDFIYGDDSVSGPTGSDELHGGAGNDTLAGGSGNNTLFGGDGDDFLVTGSGHDSIVGGLGNDLVLSDGSGNDTFLGGAGNDTIYAISGNDSFDGGEDLDTLYLHTVASALTVNMVTGTATNAGGTYNLTFTNFETIYGGSYDDSITGDAANNLIFGSTSAMGANKDTIAGGDGNDTLYGYAGNDRLKGEAGNDSIYGGDGSDRIEGGDGNDTMDGGTGNDTFIGGDGDDLVWLNTGNHTVDGGLGSDIVSYFNFTGSGIVLTSGGVVTGTGLNGTLAGIETVAATNFADNLTGTADANRFSGYDGNDTLIGAAGADNLNGGNGDDYLDGGDDNDTIFAGSGNDSILAGAGDDSINAGDGNNTVYGGDGSDIIFLANGADYVDAGAGNDTIQAAGGADTLNGGDGNDQIVAGSENDSVTGGLGNDFLYGESGNDTLDGGDGHDNITAGTNDDLVYGGAGDDTLFGNSGNDTLIGGTGTNQLIGDTGTDSLVGGDDTDSIWGGNDVDILRGGGGSDQLLGEAGADHVYGDAGNDQLWCSGWDTFYFESGSGNDVIWNFEGRGVTGGAIIAIQGGLNGTAIDDFSDLVITYNMDGTASIALGGGNVLTIHSPSVLYNFTAEDFMFY